MAKNRKAPPPTHPHGSPLLVFFISVITVGFYSYIWTSRRYREANPDARWISHWLVPAGVCVAALCVGYNFTTFLPFMIDPHTGALITAYGYYALWGVAQVVAAWWLMAHLTRTYEDQQKAPLMLMTFFFSPLAIYYLQMETNRQQDAQDVWAKWIAVVTAIIFGVGTITVVYTQYPIRQMVPELESEFRAVNEYIQCHEELSARYPNDEVGAYQYQIYLDAYEDCEGMIN